jgi:hypothetical protein
MAAKRKRAKSKAETYSQWRKRILGIQKRIRGMGNPREGSVKRYSGYRVVFLNGRYRPVKQWSHTEGLLFTAAEAKRIAKKRNATLSKRTNPRKVRGRSTTLRNMAFVTIRKLPNGVVKISGRKRGNRK